MSIENDIEYITELKKKIGGNTELCIYRHDDNDWSVGIGNTSSFVLIGESSAEVKGVGDTLYDAMINLKSELIKLIKVSYVKMSDVVEYNAIQFDGTKECADKIMEMCSHNEVIQYIDGKGLVIATINGTDYIERGDYLVCDGGCVRPVNESYFSENYHPLQ